jgi:hypothetical protein
MFPSFYFANKWWIELFLGTTERHGIWCHMIAVHRLGRGHGHGTKHSFWPRRAYKWQIWISLFCLERNLKIEQEAVPVRECIDKAGMLDQANILLNLVHAVMQGTLQRVPKSVDLQEPKTKYRVDGSLPRTKLILGLRYRRHR